jgi:RHS repeat-associated protein
VAGDWKDGLPLVEKVIDSNTGKTLRTRSKTWTSDTGTSAVNPRVASVVTQLDDGTQSAVSYAYDINGNVTDIQETDFGIGTPGPLLRETLTTYASVGNHILNRPAQIIVKNAAGVLSRKDFAYDEYAASPLAGVSPAALQHDDINYSTTSVRARGNLTTEIEYSNGAQATGAIKRSFAYDILGNRISAQDGCCTQARSSYSANTEYAYPDSVIMGPPGSALATNFTYNFASGTVASVTNANGQATTYGYDVNNRLASTHTPDGVVKSTIYDDASANPGWTSSTTADSRVTSVITDFSGHELSNNLFSGTTLISTISSAYDALGRVVQVSNPYAPSDAPVYTTYSYDAIGRTIQRTPPGLIAGVDQNSYLASHSGHATIFTDPTGRQRKENINALGELVEVDEPGDPSNGVPASTTISISGPGLQSKTLSAPAVPGTGTVTITGKEQSVVIPPPPQPCNTPPHCVTQATFGTTLPDTGNVSVTINGHTDSFPFGSLSTASGLAASLANTIRANSPYADYTNVVTNSTVPPSATINLVAKTGGGNTDYPMSAGYTFDHSDFASSSFVTTTSGPSFTGGVDAPRIGLVTLDSGTITLNVGTVTAKVPYGGTTNSTFSQVASALASALNAQSPPFNATSSGSSILIAWNSVGQAANGTQISSSATWDSTNFSSPSFSASGPSLSQGADPYPSGIAHPYVTQYSYDGLGNLTQVSQGQQQRLFSYDSLGRMTAMKIPEKASQAVTLTYTDFGGIASRTDARGIVTNYGYDPLGHLTTIHYSDGTPSVSYSFGSPGATNLSAGLLVSTADGAGSESYEYDAMGRETKCTRVIGTNTYITTYSYTLDGRIASITYPSGRIVNNSYDSLGRLTQVGTGGVNLFNINSYNASGQILGALYGNGIQASYSYNNQLQVASILIGNASPLLNLSYDWGGSSDDGLLMGVTDTVNSTRSTRYTYDQLKRLATAQTVDLTSPNTWRLQFAYDRYGNRLSQTPTGGTATMPPNSIIVDPTNNRITTASYDSDGNMTNDGINNYSFDAESRITHVNGTANTYAYDAAGSRVNRNGNYYVYAGGRVIAEYPSAAPATAPAAEYVYARKKRIATIAGGVTTYPYWDHLSIRANADASGTVVRTFGHFPFGETWYETGTHNKWDYTTYENDAESGLNYAIARFHNPRLGRFMSVDPWPADKRHPQSWNRYPHGNNNPVSFSDPTGMVMCDDDEGDCGGGGDDPGGDPAQMEDGGNGGGDEEGDGCPEGHVCFPNEPPDCVPSGDGDCVYLIPPENDSAPPDTSSSSTNTDPSEGSATHEEQQQPEQQQKPDEQNDSSCGDDVIETTIGGAAILGDIAFSWYILPEIAAAEGEGGFEALTHGGTAAVIAQVPGVMLYVNGISGMTAHCK